MYKYLLQIFVFSILLFAMTNTVFAIDYTAKRNKTHKQSLNNGELAKCNRDDLKIIKRFNYKVKEKIEEYKAIEETAPTVLSRKDAEEFTEKMIENRSFFLSDEFKEMKIIYERCGLEIPELKSEPPFWVPIDDEHNTLY